MTFELPRCLSYVCKGLVVQKLNLPVLSGNKNIFVCGVKTCTENRLSAFQLLKNRQAGRVKLQMKVQFSENHHVVLIWSKQGAVDRLLKIHCFILKYKLFIWIYFI